STDPTGDVTVDDVVRRLVGREVSDLYPKQPATVGDVLLEVTGLTQTGTFHDVDLTVRAGEVVGLAGLVGAGRSEIAQAVFGVDPYESGIVRMRGRTVPKGDPAAAMAMGIALVPEDRRRHGLVLESSVARNITMVTRSALSRSGLLTTRAENAVAREWAGRLEVKTATLDALAGTLSGGNQQKVVLAKWLSTRPEVLIIDEPTRGIDVGTKAEVHRLLSTLAAEGVGILMISSELPEVLGVADRVVVVNEGRVTAELDREDATPETVMFAATKALETQS
ncbi:MAG: ATP-binding cassette domain-containing protein, partial [Nocardioidaceae bacterium]